MTAAADSPDRVIEVRGLVTRFGRNTIHEGLDLEVRRGEILGLVGGSGTGKSVLMNTIVGLRRPQGGSVRVLGYDPHSRSARERRRLLRHVGVMFQDGALFSGLTVLENVMVPIAESTDVPAPLARQIAAMKIGMSGLPPDAGAKYPAQLSGGMRKRSGLARALALDPDILFLDEPTAGLDPIGANAFDRLVMELSEAIGLTVFLVTHDLDTLVTACDRIAVLLDRRITVGTLDELMAMDHPWLRAYFHGPRMRAALGDKAPVQVSS
ncbi:MAG: ATP-binding cassette domain-containing protein [Azospirillaceae bacterium]